MSSEQAQGENDIQIPLITSSSDPEDFLHGSNTTSNPIRFRLMCRPPIRRLNINRQINPEDADNNFNFHNVCNHQQGHNHIFLCNDCRSQRGGGNLNLPLNNPYNIPQELQNDEGLLDEPPENLNEVQPDPNNPRFIEPFNFNLNLIPNNNEPFAPNPEPVFNPFHVNEHLINFQAPFPAVNEPVAMDNAPDPFLNQPAFKDFNRKAKNVDIVSTRYATLAVIVIFTTSILTLFLVYKTFPKVTEEESTHIKVPWNIEDAKQLGIVLNRYKGDNYYHVMAAVFLSYIFLQTFAIPGSLFLSILSGFLFPFYTALILVCTCSMIGATLCFMLSQLLGRKLVLKHFPERASKWAVQVEKHKDNLFNYMVFLRITPILPNWFINLTAPVIGVPLIPFAFGTFIGVAPPSFFAIQGGQTLLAMTAEDNAFNMQTLGWLGIFALVSIIPIFLKNKV